MQQPPPPGKLPPWAQAGTQPVQPPQVQPQPQVPAAAPPPTGWAQQQMVAPNQVVPVPQQVPPMQQAPPMQQMPVAAPPVAVPPVVYQPDPGSTPYTVPADPTPAYPNPAPAWSVVNGESGSWTQQPVPLGNEPLPGLGDSGGLADMMQDAIAMGAPPHLIGKHVRCPFCLLWGSTDEWWTHVEEYHPEANWDFSKEEE